MLRYIYIFITAVAASQSCAEDFSANMPCIIISLTHLFVSLGISESKKVCSAAQRRSLNEALPRQQSRLPTAFAHQRKPDEGEILSWLDKSFRKQKMSHASLIILFFFFFAVGFKDQNVTPVSKPALSL